MSSGSYRTIDVPNWKRARHYALYAEAPYPYVSFTADLDITALRANCKRRGLNFFSAFLFAVTRAVNGIENFRYRVVDGEVVLFDHVDLNFTVFDAVDELFYFAEPGFSADIETFSRLVEEAKRRAVETKCLSGDRQDVVHVSCTPWFRFSDVIQPLPIQAGCAIPKILWGKYESVGDVVTIPFSATGHHGLLDAFHIGRLFEAVVDIANSDL